MEKVSIIVPVYNTKKELLEKCINSIINQTYKKLEILILDDGSKKETAEFCDSFLKRDDRIKIFHQKNQGVSQTRNNGVQLSTGNYIAFIDADDYVNDTYIERLYTTLKNDNSDIVFTACNKIYGKKVEPQVIYQTQENQSLKSNIEKREFSPYNLDLMGTVWGKLYKKSLILDVKFDKELCFGEDIVFNFKVFNDNIKYSYINEYSYQYIVNESSAIRRYNEDTILLYEKTINKIKEYIETDNSKEKREAYLLFVCTIYRVIVMNYICNKNNSMNLKEKKVAMKELRESSLYKFAIENADFNKLRFSRRLPLILAKNNKFKTLYFLIKLREIQCNLYMQGE